MQKTPSVVKRKHGGQIKFHPTKRQRDEVAVLVAAGVPYETVARLIENPRTGKPITAKTLMVAFRAELDDAGSRAHSRVAKSLFDKATGNGTQAVTAAIWWTKTRMGWRETIVNENHNIDDTAEADKELARRLLQGPAVGGEAQAPGGAESGGEDSPPLRLDDVVGEA
jgi:hypothetical protein